MISQDLLTTILDYLVTSLDREVLIEELEAVKANLFEQKKDMTQHALGSLPYWLTPRILEACPDFSRAKIDELLAELITALRAVQVAQLSLTYTPTTKQIWQYLHVCRKHFGGGLVLQITQNPDIIGGVVLTYNGEQIDLSLQTKLSKEYA